MIKIKTRAYPRVLFIQKKSNTYHYMKKKTILAVMGLELVASGVKTAILTTRPLILLAFK